MELINYEDAKDFIGLTVLCGDGQKGKLIALDPNTSVGCCYHVEKLNVGDGFFKGNCWVASIYHSDETAKIFQLQKEVKELKKKNKKLTELFQNCLSSMSTQYNMYSKILKDN